MNEFVIDYRGHIWALPPSTESVTPVVNDESSLAKNAIALATSSVVPTLPKAWVVLLCSKNYSNQILIKYSFVKITF
jgi:hypothetical protein